MAPKASLDLEGERAAVTAAAEEPKVALLRVANTVSDAARNASILRAPHAQAPLTHVLLHAFVAGLEQPTEYDHEEAMEEEEEEKLLAQGIERDSHKWEDHMLQYRAMRQLESERNAGIENSK